MNKSKSAYAASATSLKPQPNRGSTALPVSSKPYTEQFAEIKVEQQDLSNRPSIMDEAYNVFSTTERIDRLLDTFTERLTGNGSIKDVGEPHPNSVLSLVAGANNNLCNIESRLNWLLSQVGDNGPGVAR